MIRTRNSKENKTQIVNFLFLSFENCNLESQTHWKLFLGAAGGMGIVALTGILNANYQN